MNRATVAGIALAVVLTAFAGIVCAVVVSPSDGYVDECHALGGRVLTRNGFDRLCLGPGGMLPLADGWR